MHPRPFSIIILFRKNTNIFDKTFFSSFFINKCYNKRELREDKKMAKIIAVNAGSSSLKFQLFEMDDESVITSGVIERIGLEDSIFTIKFNGQKDVRTLPIPTHKEAVHLLLDTLLEKNIVSSLEDIKGVGHRVVQGGSYFKESAIIDDDVVSKIDELKSLAPLHNPAH